VENSPQNAAVPNLLGLLRSRAALHRKARENKPREQINLFQADHGELSDGTTAVCVASHRSRSSRRVPWIASAMSRRRYAQSESSSG